MEIVSRIEKITRDAKRQWGKMEVDQMLAHCGNGLEMAMGIIKPKRIFIGRIIGPLFKKKYVDDTPFDHDNPTSDELRITGRKNFEGEKQRLILLLENFSMGGESAATQHPHPFFGPLKPAEWGIGMYKHLDHHLRQFGG